MSSTYAAIGFQPGYSDLLAIIRDAPRESDIDANAGSIAKEYLIAAESLSLRIDQSSDPKNRRAGEGADPNAFVTSPVTIRATIKMPIRASVTGYIDWAFAALWDAALLARWGTATAAMSRIVTNTPSVAVSSGASSFVVDNISDFLAIPTPFQMSILAAAGSGQTSETVLVSGVNKTNRTLTFSSPTAHPHTPNNTILSARITTGSAPVREPAFSLLSLREGLFSPCLVNKITIDADIESGVYVTVEFASLRLWRDKQIDLRTQQKNILTAFSTLPPTRKIDPMLITINPKSANIGNFGLATPQNHPLFAGFQGLDYSSTVTGISITIDNQIQEIYAAHSLSNDPSIRQLENSYPFALVSQGRKISGTLRYKSPIAPFTLMERLAGPSSINGGGIEINYSDFVISLPEIAWSLSTSEGDVKSDQSREIQWTMISENYDEFPELKFS
jgi:hypothetical protein